jgi:hypothetical protein
VSFLPQHCDIALRRSIAWENHPFEAAAHPLLSTNHFTLPAVSMLWVAPPLPRWVTLGQQQVVTGS